MNGVLFVSVLRRSRVMNYNNVNTIFVGECFASFVSSSFFCRKVLVRL